MKILPGRAADVFLKGLKALDLNTGGIPDFAVMNPKLQALTGWTVECVPGLVPDEVFFDHLANRRFPSGQFIRKPDQLDYSAGAGHLPRRLRPCADADRPDFAAYMEAYGKGGQRAASLGMLQKLARLYWYTVEFGLMQDARGLRIYGAGIVSSATESVFALDDPSPNRLGFALERVMRPCTGSTTSSRSISSSTRSRQLKDETLKDFGPIYEALKGADRHRRRRRPAGRYGPDARQPDLCGAGRPRSRPDL
jgi:phenylalanine-4-hydroxylase